MKRCPQCEFIYEDDQSLCDMDGVLLVFDSRNLPNLHALAPLSGPAAKAQKRNRTAPAFATLILVIVLGMVYFVTQRSAATYTPADTTSTIAPVVIPAPPVPTPTETRIPEKVEEPKPAPVKKSSTTKIVSAQPKPPAEQKKKDDSKVGSILKKTGRILKKPFKF